MEEEQSFTQKEVIQNELDQFEKDVVDPYGQRPQAENQLEEEESRIKSAEAAECDQESSLSFVDIDEAVMGLKELQASSVYDSKNELSPDLNHFRTSQQTTFPLTANSLKASTNYEAIADGASPNSFISPQQN